MSKPRYDWWSYAKAIIRRYPALRREYDLLHDTSFARQISGMPHAQRISDPTAAVALRELPCVQQREYDAVHKAVSMTQALPNGALRLRVVSLVLWDKSHTLEGAALEIPCCVRTAKQWHGDFIRLVGANFGLMG